MRGAVRGPVHVRGAPSWFDLLNPERREGWFLEWRTERTAELLSTRSQGASPKTFPPQNSEHSAGVGGGVSNPGGQGHLRIHDPGATLLRDGGGVHKVPTKPFQAVMPKQRPTWAGGAAPGKQSLEADGGSCLPRCPVWKEKWTQRLTVPASRQPPWALAAQGCAWKNVLLALGRSTRLLSWPEPGPASVPGRRAVELASQEHCRLFV